MGLIAHVSPFHFPSLAKLNAAHDDWDPTELDGVFSDEQAHWNVGIFAGNAEPNCSQTWGGGTYQMFIGKLAGPKIETVQKMGLSCFLPDFTRKMITNQL